MNMLFGLIPSLTTICLLVFLWNMRVITRKTGYTLSVIALLITAYFSLQTYGPRNELATTAIPEPPERVEVESGKKLVDHKDRSKTFTEQLGR